MVVHILVQYPPPRESAHGMTVMIEKTTQTLVAVETLVKHPSPSVLMGILEEWETIANLLQGFVPLDH